MIAGCIRERIRDRYDLEDLSGESGEGRGGECSAEKGGGQRSGGGRISWTSRQRLSESLCITHSLRNSLQ